MKTDLSNLSSYTKNFGKVPSKNGKAPLVGDKKLVDKLTKAPEADYKLELSGQKPTSSLPSLPTPPTPSLSLPETPSLAKPEAPKEIKEAVKKVAKDELKVEKTEIKKGGMKKPLIVFIKGLDVFSSPLTSETGYAGVRKMAEAVDGARVYGYDQKNEIIKEIEKTHKDYPVILVGHSFGGDTAVEIANELDSLEHNFRKVNLLITMDAVGFGNDIIPQNVKEHLNIFGENNFFLNDGPHVARRHEMTNVKNILSPLDHTDIDDDKEIQFEVMSLIQEVISKDSPGI